MKNLTIVSLLAALTAVTVVQVSGTRAAIIGDAPCPVVRDKDQRAPFWPGIDSKSIVDEWYSDVPWHQKLGTYAGNEIVAPLIIPYEALSNDAKTYCAIHDFQRDRCMLEMGVVNVLGMRRIDTPYRKDDPRIMAAAECKDGTCIEVRLEVSSFQAKSKGPSQGCDLEARTLGNEPQHRRNGFNDYYGGYVITDGSTYAPQMPWYMAHYCDAGFQAGLRDTQDPACYGDYLSPFNDGFAPRNVPLSPPLVWPEAQAWSVFPSAPPPAVSNHCLGAKDPATTDPPPPSYAPTKCTLAMAGFDLSKPVSSALASLQYPRYNGNLFTWFNNALKAFGADFSEADLLRKFPWDGTPVSWETFLYPQAVQNPFLGQFNDAVVEPVKNCEVNLDGNDPPNCPETTQRRASQFLYPRQCNLGDLAGGDVARLRRCGLNYELHHNGYLEQWPESFWPDVRSAGMLANQYGRTSFLFAGVPGMQAPVPFNKSADGDSGLNVYEQVYNASIFSLYLPIANEADRKRAFNGRNYTDAQFYHTLLMTNHMESDPAEFAEGIRGKVLWHNEYRTQGMYEQSRPPINNPKFPTQMFAASFDDTNAKAPFHNNTCDGCHVRNGSGVPINTANMLDAAIRQFMDDKPYDPYPVKDYTFTGQIRPMKLVFFDLKRSTVNVDASRYSEPLSFPADLRVPGVAPIDNLYYNNKVMNFYGDSFHLNRAGYGYAWNYKKVDPNRLVVAADRTNAELGKTYELLQVALNTFQTDPSCQLLPSPGISNPWPSTCADIGDDAIHDAIDKKGEVGFMHLNGKRLGNLSAIEAIPNKAIQQFQADQAAVLGQAMAGEIVWNAGSRDGVGGKVEKHCVTSSLKDCFIGRFGFLGDRGSLEDQVANAAFVEMNLLTSEGYKKLYSSGKPVFPIRYGYPNCGPADKACMAATKGNGDLSEADINRMAAYARWLGSPTRSEFQAALPDVVAGEKVFRQVKCDGCHVIRKIDIDPEDTVLTREFRDRLQTRVTNTAKPFLSYIGTDLLMHDMGYLSQVGFASQSIRDTSGIVLPDYRNYVQKIRTPPLKGLRFNRFVTASHNNTRPPLQPVGQPLLPPNPACDFLLHDGRACDAIEAAFLHDGPAIKKLGVIDGLIGLSKTQLRQLRAFLYSL